MPQASSDFDFQETVGSGYFEMVVSPKDAPFIEVSESADSLVTLNVLDLPISLKLFNKNGLEIVDTTLRVSASGDANLTVDNNTIGIDLIGLPITNVDFKSLNINLTDSWQYGASKEEKDQLGEIASQIAIYLMPGVVEMIERSAGMMKVPTLAGFSINLDEFSSEDNIIGMKGRLVSSQGSNRINIDIPNEVTKAMSFCKKIDHF